LDRISRWRAVSEPRGRTVRDRRIGGAVAQHELLDLYEQAADWTQSKVAGALDQLTVQSTCDGWDVRTLLNHMLDTQRYFTAAALGEQASLPSAAPPELVGTDPVGAFERSCTELISAFRAQEDGDKKAMGLGIAFADQLVHGWDVARSTGQGTTMPDGLAAAAYEFIHGRFTDAQRTGVFKPEVHVPGSASPQDKLLAYSGRDPR
jgi:uncharacterized protein (TIGR03086 family)